MTNPFLQKITTLNLNTSISIFSTKSLLFRTSIAAGVAILINEWIVYVRCFTLRYFFNVKYYKFTCNKFF